MLRRATLRLPIGAAWLAFAGACAPPDPAEGMREAADVFAALGEPLPDASDDQRESFERGREVFARRLTPDDGLGPRFNATFCGGCHEKPVSGGTAARYRNVFVRQDEGPSIAIEMQPQYELGDTARAPDEPGVDSAVRSPSPLFGLGLLGEIPIEEILSRHDPNDIDGDGISGRVNFERGFVGRFGRKAQIATLPGFVRLALVDHLGVTTDPVGGRPQFDFGPDVPMELPTRDDDVVPDPELGTDDVADLVTFVALLAPPEPAAQTEAAADGRELFADLACTACHVPALSGPRGPIPAYTDLLLHDMGPQLADGVAVGEATGAEFRTQPLWGVAAFGPYLHDGRADTLEAAIEAHGGEAEASRERFAALTDDERGAVVAFLIGLGGQDHRPDGLLAVDAPLPAPGDPGGPHAALDPEAASRFEVGRDLFDHDWGIGAGLGPRFNGDSCRGCHFEPDIGGAGPGGVDVIRYGTIAADGSFTAPADGTVAHRHGTEPTRPRVSGGANLFERRQTPSLFGLGLVEQIDDATIVAGADPDDADGDGIAGIVHTLPDGRIGRFGWKADVPTLEDFARDALSTELGLTVPATGSSFGVASDLDDAPDPEVSPAQLADLTFFMAQLAPPRRHVVDAAAEAAGAEIFADLGCAACHVPELPASDGTPVRLYSDLLLHEIADDPAGHVPHETAGTRFRTPPLWGLARSAPYLHDGSAATVDAAIGAHAGEAAPTRDAYEALDPSERAQLRAFLVSL